MSIDHCQGCGTKAGDPVVRWGNHCIKETGQVVRVPRNQGDAVLATISLAEWKRTLCQVCRRHADVINANLSKFGVAKPSKVAKSKPLERQLQAF